jgi:predicted nucleic acid-binding protein
MIVADTGPLIAFARIGRLDLLRQVVGALTIPDAVHAELVTGGRHRPGVADVEQGEWIHRTAVQDQAAVARLPAVLHLGEREAIILASELGAQLCIDEQRGRNVAAARGIPLAGSLHILAEAKRSGLIDRARPMVAALLDAGYWFDEELLRSFFIAMGE